ARLLVDLLAHEPVVAVLLRGGQVPVHVVRRRGTGAPVDIGDRDGVRGDRDDLVLAQLDRVRVCSMKAATSEARKCSPSPTPTTSGELRRAATTASGAAASTATRVNAPSSRGATARIAVVRSAPAATSRASRCTTISVSVSAAGVTPSAASSSRRAAQFS